MTSGRRCADGRIRGPGELWPDARGPRAESSGGLARGSPGVPAFGAGPARWPAGDAEEAATLNDMYVPAHFAADDLDKIAAFVDRAGSADLVTFDGTAPVATLLPVIWDRSAGEHGRLLGHVARSNPQWSTAAAGVPALAIVHGPQAYISPSWYQSTKEHGRTVPTWNYTTVHFTGPVAFHRDADWLRDVVTRLTERYEAGREGRWWVGDAPEQFIAGQLRAIVGVELLVRADRGQGQAVPEPAAAGPGGRDRRAARRARRRRPRHRRPDVGPGGRRLRRLSPPSARHVSRPARRCPGRRAAATRAAAAGRRWLAPPAE